ncbi:MAG: Mrp/NBP35 family ATP-binding protein [Anaerolineales bacterium]|nr:Mrp/NBP35 family ATP-binding protein [Anaerolineales bacterium]
MSELNMINEPAQEENNRIRFAVAVASGKGGVGKSTVAVNLAVALAQKGLKIGLMDADIYGPNVPTMMGVTSLPETQGPKLLPAVAHGVKIISIGFLVPPGQPLIWRGPMLHGAIRQFVQDVDWGELDMLVIDLPPGTGDAQLSLAQTLPLTGGVIVTLPQKVSLEDALRGLEMFRTMDVDVLGVIENMSFLEMPDGQKMDIFGEGGGQDLARDAGVPFLGAIPIDPAVRQGGDEGVPITIAKPDSPAARALSGIATALVETLNAAEPDESGDFEIEITD